MFVFSIIHKNKTSQVQLIHTNKVTHYYKVGLSVRHKAKTMRISHLEF